MSQAPQGTYVQKKLSPKARAAKAEPARAGAKPPAPVEKEKKPPEVKRRWLGGREVMVVDGKCAICEKPPTKRCGRLNHSASNGTSTVSEAPCRGCGGPVGVVTPGQEKFYCEKTCRKRSRHSKKTAAQAAA